MYNFHSLPGNLKAPHNKRSSVAVQFHPRVPRADLVLVLTIFKRILICVGLIMIFTAMLSMIVQYEKKSKVEKRVLYCWNCWISVDINQTNFQKNRQHTIKQKKTPNLERRSQRKSIEHHLAKLLSSPIYEDKRLIFVSARPMAWLACDIGFLINE